MHGWQQRYHRRQHCFHFFRFGNQASELDLVRIAQEILEIDNNTAERAMRAIALGRKNYLDVGSSAGGRAAAVAYTLIETAKLNGVDPQTWLADTIARIPDYKITRVNDLLPWK